MKKAVFNAMLPWRGDKMAEQKDLSSPPLRAISKPQITVGQPSTKKARNYKKKKKKKRYYIYKDMEEATETEGGHFQDIIKCHTCRVGNPPTGK